jgi:thioredoxin-related protein
MSERKNGFIWVFILLILFVQCSTKEKPVENVSPVKNERPSMTVSMGDGRQVDIKNLEEKIVLVLFQPDCDHCQREAREIHDHLEAFREYQLYFISSHPMEVIQQFAKDYDLDNKPNVYFANTAVDNVLNNFGAISAPSVYIYNKEGKLVKNLNGESKIEEIIKYL